MVVDSSAFVAILDEPDGPDYLNAADRHAPHRVSALTLYETRIVLSGRRDGRRRFREGAEDQLSALLTGLAVEIVPFTEPQAVLAHQAYLRFGRGFHPAALNLGRLRRLCPCPNTVVKPLLFKGEDFAQTDVERALTGPGQVP